MLISSCRCRWIFGGGVSLLGATAAGVATAAPELAAAAIAAAGPQVSHGLQLQSLWRIPTAAVS